MLLARLGESSRLVDAGLRRSPRRCTPARSGRASGAWGHLDEADAPPRVEVQAKVEELLQDVLSAGVALDQAVLVEQHHVACAGPARQRCGLPEPSGAIL